MIRLMMFFWLAALTVGCAYEEVRDCTEDKDCPQSAPFCIEEVHLCSKTEICDPSVTDCNPDGGAPLGGISGEQPEQCPNEGQLCTVGVGACEATGTITCLNGEPACNAAPGEAQDKDPCDGIDNDCDGQVDEDHEKVPCVAGLGVCQKEGTNQCIQGSVICDAEPTDSQADKDETCDGLDDDCDGRVDEDTGDETQTCGVGACLVTYVKCNGEPEVCSDGRGDLSLSSEETCNGIDDDCDGKTDEQVPGVGNACNYQPDGCEATLPGILTCNHENGLACASDPLQEVHDNTCNSIDDDCDGRVDEDINCEPIDTDGDGVADEDDLCPLIPSSGIDSDNNGVGDECDYICRNQEDGSRICLFRHELTRGMFRLAQILAMANGLSFEQAPGCTLPAALGPNGNVTEDDSYHPISCVSKNTAQAMAQLMTTIYQTAYGNNVVVRLPTQSAELYQFYDGVYPHGANLGDLSANYQDRNPSFEGVAAVSSHPDGTTREGVSDLAGNVAEMTDSLCTVGGKFDSGPNPLRVNTPSCYGNQSLYDNSLYGTGVRYIVTFPAP